MGTSETFIAHNKTVEDRPRVFSPTPGHIAATFASKRRRGSPFAAIASSRSLMQAVKDMKLRNARRCERLGRRVRDEMKKEQFNA
jgi:hypothetical protein